MSTANAAMKAALIGLGSGMDTLTQAAKSALQEADLVIGASRLLDEVRATDEDGRDAADSESFSGNGTDRGAAITREYLAEFWPDKIADLLLSHKDDWKGRKIALVYSGDTGFYSGAGSFLREVSERLPDGLDLLSEEAERLSGIEITVYPGISSVQLLSSAVGAPWQDWTLVSAHGRGCDPAGEIRRGKDTFFLTGGRTGVKELCRELSEAELGSLHVVVGENLGMENQRLTRCTLSEAAESEDTEFSPLAVMLVEGYSEHLPAMGIPDERFIRGEVPMTKRDVRLAVLTRMQAAPGETVWDVGAGTGSVSVELARQARGGIVYAVESKADACALIEENRRAFHLTNLKITRGKAPDALEDLPAPDAVFIGGSSGSLSEIVQAAARKNPKVRIVLTGIVLETVGSGIEALQALGRDPEVTQIAVTRTRTVGKRKIHMLTAENPVFVISG